MEKVVGVRKYIAKAFLESIYARIITDREHPLQPEWDAATPISFSSRDGIALHGWSHRPEPGGGGTIFFCHGYTLNCHHQPYLLLARHFSEHHRFASIGFDFRHHGLSSDAPPTFGTAESWDIRGAIDFAENNGFPKPYIVYGDSLGALAAQRATIDDERIDGAVFKASPSSPLEAIDVSCSRLDASILLNQVAGQLGIPKLRFPPIYVGWICNLARLARMYYGFDILRDGDILHHSASPRNRPRLLYVMGDEDEYGWRRTQLRFEHWYEGEPAKFNAWPEAAPDQMKWFVLAEGRDHNFGAWNWSEFLSLLDQYISYFVHRSTTSAA